MLGEGIMTTLFDPDEALALARIDIERNELGAALARLKPLALDPRASAQAVLMLARLYGQMKLPQRAQPLFQRYLEATPDAVHERFELGMTQLDQREIGAALGTWGQVLSLRPNYPPALFYSAVAQAEAAQPAQANRLLDALFETTTEDNLYHQRGRELLQALPQSEGDAALGDYSRLDGPLQ